MKLISWNIARRRDAWEILLSSDADIGILQEANMPPKDLIDNGQIDNAQWETVGADVFKTRNWRTAIVKISPDVIVEWFEPKSIENAIVGEFGVSQTGTLSAAKVTPVSGESIIIISAYGLWKRPHDITESKWIMADASVHRLISDISCFVGHEKKHKLIVSGDLNILYGYGESGSKYWADRYQSVFSRMAAIGIPFIGPQAPEGGRQAAPWPKELPIESRNVPTFYTNQQTPGTATRQLDFVFASESIKDRLKVHARNHPDDWGPSDHCRIEIEFE
jgi:exonuclease III